MLIREFFGTKRAMIRKHLPLTKVCVYIFFFFCLASCSFFRSGDSLSAQNGGVQEQKKNKNAEQSGPTYTYQFVFDEKSDTVKPEVKAAVLSLIKKNSQLEFLKKQPMDNEFALVRRINNDVQAAKEVLEAYGYYSGKVKYRLEKKDGLDHVVITLYPGEQYKISTIAIKYTHSTVLPEYFKTYENKRESIFKKYTPYKVPVFEKKVDMQNRYAVAEDILKTVERLPFPLLANGYPNAKIASSAYSLDKSRKELKGTVFINQGLPATMGEVKLSGNTEVSDAYILKLCPWRVGAVWDVRYLYQYRDSLQKTGLFESVKIEYDKKVYRAYNKKYRTARKAEKNKDIAVEPVQLPVLLEVKEGKKRSVGGIASYSTDQGLGVEAQWEHRNFFGSGEILKLTMPLKDEELYLGAELKKPAFGFKEQNLVMRSRAGYEKTDAYNQKFIEYGVGIDREIHEKWWLESMLYADYIIPKKWQGEEYSSLTFSNILKYDKRDSKMNPSQGYVSSVKLAPMYGFGNVDFFALVSELDTSWYLPLGKSTVLALRGACGTMFGADGSMPRGKRFFLGGGGSVRGFEHQEIGRHDPNDDPYGGISYLLFNSEIRQYITKDFAVVPFMDGGMVYDDVQPDLSEKLAVGAGIGFRYNTPVGPVRLDIAVPLTGAYRGDDKDITDFQLYISIGQAF